MSHTSDDSSLFLCRTPLQAKICDAIISNENIKEFDLIYFSSNDSEVDRFYYDCLRVKSRRSLYLYSKKRKPDILNHLISIFKFSKAWHVENYSRLYLASIDSFLFRYIVKKSAGARLFGFDDGAANLSNFGNYYNFNSYKRAKFYSRILGLPSVNSVRSSIFRHYTIYKGFDNIVPSENTVWLDVFGFGSSGGCESMDNVTFFIGQPFFEYLTTDEVGKLSEWVARQKIDFYIMHPRETAPIIFTAKILKSNGLLAEDLISETLKGNSATVIAGYSSVLFNIPSDNVQKIYLSIKKDAYERERLNLIEKAGCHVKII